MIVIKASEHINQLLRIVANVIRAFVLKQRDQRRNADAYMGYRRPYANRVWSADIKERRTSYGVGRM